LMKLAMPTVMVALPRPFAVPCARICVTMFYPKWFPPYLLTLYCARHHCHVSRVMFPRGSV
jgi:hypothetical protein